MDDAVMLEEAAESTSLPLPMSAADLLDKDFAPVEFAIEPYFPRAEVTELVGAHGIFKSTCALGACLAVVTGRTWGGASVNKGAAVFITMEDGERTLAHRIRAWLDSIPAGREREEAETAVRADFFYLAREHARDLALTDTDRGSTFQRGPVIGHLSAWLNGASLVVLETASRLHGGPELNEALAVFAQAVERIAIFTKAAVVIVRHVSKQAARDGVADSYAGRGGGALSDAARSVLVMTRDKKGEGSEDAEDDAISTVTLTHAKASLSAPGPRIVWRPVPTEHGVYLWPLSSREKERAEEQRLLAHLRCVGPAGLTQTDLHKKPIPGLPREAAKKAVKRLVADRRVAELVEDRNRNKGVVVYRIAGGSDA